MIGGLLQLGLGPVTQLLSGAASAAAGALIKVIAGWILGGLGSLIAAMSTVWLATPTPAVVDGAGNAIGTTAWTQHELIWFTGALAVLSILVGAGRIAWAERGGEEARRLAVWLLTFVAVSAAGVGAAGVLIVACDQLAGWLISQSTAGQNFGQHLANSLGLVAQTTGSATLNPAAGFLVGLAGTEGSAILAVLVGVLALFASIIEFTILIVRGGVLVLLVGILPFAAAWSNLPTGEKWLRRIVGWIIALALYKPAAALVYAVAFQLSAGQNIAQVLSGLGLLFISLAALPALLRIVMPAAEGFEHHRGMAGAAGAAVGGLASGAIAIGVLTGGGGAALATAGGAADAIGNSGGSAADSAGGAAQTGAEGATAA